jgi:hypothetical protein
VGVQVCGPADVRGASGPAGPAATVDLPFALVVGELEAVFALVVEEVTAVCAGVGAGDRESESGAFARVGAVEVFEELLDCGVGMPLPWSLTEMRRWLSCWAAVRMIGGVPWAAALMSRLEMIRSRASGSATTARSSGTSSWSRVLAGIASAAIFRAGRADERFRGEG